jgi:hypothetical protein
MILAGLRTVGRHEAVHYRDGKSSEPVNDLLMAELSFYSGFMRLN